MLEKEKKNKKVFAGLCPKKSLDDLTRQAGGANKRVFVGLSGGVDSSVAAALLKKQGYNVAGVFMRFWKDGQAGHNACCSVESEAKALAVAKKIGIPFYIFNFEAEFKKAVVDYFLQELRSGRTPNPCVVCNPKIKFGLFLERARKMGADYVATGHYASLRREDSVSDPPGSVLAQSKAGRFPKKSKPQNHKYSYKLFTAKDEIKDQSYFLHRLTQRQLSRVLFPLGGYLKSEVYKLAKKWRLPHQSHQSFDICFAADYPVFLKKHLKLKPGKIVNLSDKTIGQHQGLSFYTIGQRASIGGPGPFWVVKKDVKKNLLLVSNDDRDLFKKEMLVERLSWISGINPKLAKKYKVKIRYGAKSVAAIPRLRSGQKLFVAFEKSQRAITPGQSAVFYGEGNEVLGGGIIK